MHSSEILNAIYRFVARDVLAQKAEQARGVIPDAYRLGYNRCLTSIAKLGSQGGSDDEILDKIGLFLGRAGYVIMEAYPIASDAPKDVIGFMHAVRDVSDCIVE